MEGEIEREGKEVESTMTATQASVLTEKDAEAPFETLNSGNGLEAAEVSETGRAVVDTSAPFESVKEAVNRFGGSAVWKSQLKQLSAPDKHHSVEDIELVNVRVEATQLEKVLIIKERETLEVFKELEKTKRTADDLKIRLHEELSEADEVLETLKSYSKLQPAVKHERVISCANFIHGGMKATGYPGSILVELSQAKMILSRTSSFLTDIQASIESIKNKLQKEKVLLDKNMEKLSSKRAIVSSLDEDLKKMTFKHQLSEYAKDNCSGDLGSLSIEIKNLSSEREHFKQATEDAKLQVLRLTSEIEQINVSTKAIEIRWLAAKKMEEAAKATEAAALSQTKGLITGNSSEVILSTEEYDILLHKVQEAEETSRKKIECAMLEVERANLSKLDVIAEFDQAALYVHNNKKFLEEAMNRADAANRGKLAIEDALRRWRSDHGQRRRYVHNSKFKNSCPGHQRRDLRMLDINGLNLVNDDLRKELKHTLSIGEILSRKLFGPGDGDYNTGMYQRSNEKAKVSLGQMLNRRAEVSSPKNSGGPARKQHLMKRKRFGLVLFSHVMKNKRSKRKKTKKNKKRKQVCGTW